MKHFFISLWACCIFLPGVAQEAAKPWGFQFTTLKEIPITPVKNQSSSGTCWSFSGLGLIEAELLRQGKGEHDLSEMFIVHKNYGEKAQKYVRMNGTINFAGGGSFADVLDCIRDYGIVPDAIQTGLNYGDTVHRHGELDQTLKAYIGAIVKNPNKKLSTAWYRAYIGIVNAYLGECPESFTYNGKQYTPKTYAQSLGIHAEDYISLTSFTHHPFYTAFPIEIPDNWRWSDSYNLPLNELMQLIDNALDKGYCVAWASDVSSEKEKEFSRKGIAMVPDVHATEGPGSDQAHWLGLSQTDKEALIANFTSPVPEKKITQEMRQEAFDNYETTDDHGMLIYGTAQDQNGSKYYLVKNSWGTASPYHGIWYVSVPFVEYKTISIVVHKDAIPKEIRKKLGL
ncbi:MAG: aminopeptidase [Dysgonamonadaceae bacterium]|jgi:aminopeptidase C|nr:aminopeptidase [Dysgonamonadaceae bacterium]